MPTPSLTPETFATFGELLRYLRRRARLSQRELSIAVGYSEAHLSRLELNQRLPDLATIAAVFVPALELEAEPATAARLLELAALARQAAPNAALPEAAEQAPESTPSRLPRPLTEFVGRVDEQARLGQLLAASRLVTLTGMGGCGKTRLALAAAGQAALATPRTWFVDLASLSDPALVAGAAIAVLGVPPPRDRAPIEALIAFLGPSPCLLVVDNAEHVLSGVAPLAEALLGGCPALRLLVTSREPLNLPGETVFAVPPLATDSAASDAVQLFLARARERLPDLALTEAELDTVVTLCQQLDGLPLAIELAAARLAVLSVAEIAARLDDRFGLLTAGPRTALPRQKTLRAAMDWSYALLPEPEQALLRGLAVFAGGFTLAALTALWPGEAFERLSQLAAKSLVVVERHVGGETRYRLLETVRAYGLEQLRAAGEETAVQARHLRFYAAWAEAAEQGLHGQAQATWLARLEAEHGNLRAALETACQSVTAPLAEMGLRLALALGHFWFVRGYADELRGWVGRLLALAHQPAHTRARALALAQSAFWADSPAEAHSRLQASLALAQHLEDEDAAANAYFIRGTLAWVGDDLARGRADFEHGLKLYRVLGDDWHTARALAELGEFAQVRLDDRALARASYEESLRLAHALGDQRGQAIALVHLGDVALEQGDVGAAHAYCREGLAAAGEINDGEALAWGLNGLGIVAMSEGRLEDAVRLCAESLALSETWCSAWHVMIRRYWLARAVQYQGDAARAAALYEETLVQAVGFDWGRAVARHGLGTLAAARGDRAQAGRHFSEALTVLHAGRYGYSLAYGLDAFAALAAAEQQPERAVRLFAAADALRERIGAALLPPEQDERQRALASAMAALDAATLTSVKEEGRALALDAAVALALEAAGA